MNQTIIAGELTEISFSEFQISNDETNFLSFMVHKFTVKLWTNFKINLLNS